MMAATAEAAEALSGTSEAPRRTINLKDVLALHNAALVQFTDTVDELRAEVAILRAEVDHLNAAAAYCQTCGRSACVNPDFCQLSPAIDKDQERHPAPAVSGGRPTPQSTVEAVVHCVRERGPAALEEPDNVERLRRCDPAALAQINQRIAKIKGTANHE